jgi:hypothetical protein
MDSGDGPDLRARKAGVAKDGSRLFGLRSGALAVTFEPGLVMTQLREVGFVFGNINRPFVFEPVLFGQKGRVFPFEVLGL